MIRSEGLRSQLAEILDTYISDALWDYWIEQGYIQRILTGELSLNSAVSELRRALGAYREQQGYGEVAAQVSHLPSPAAEDTSVRESRFEDLVAWAADQDPAVRAFCTEVLHDHRVPDERKAVDAWLDAHEDAERAMDIWIKDVQISPTDRTVLRTAIQAAFTPAMPASDGLEPEQPLTVTVHLPVAQFPWQLSLRVLHCRLSEWGGVRHIPVTEGGVLDRLRALAVYLAPRYGWDEADAANFVLTGAPQPTPRIRSEVTLVEPLSVMSRITLTIDPSMKPSEVARYYDDLRYEVTSKRPRELSEKHLELAHFTAKRPKKESWRQRMKVWNRQYPQFAYEHERNFERDALQAEKRLLHPDYREPPWSPLRLRTVKHIRR